MHKVSFIFICNCCFPVLHQHITVVQYLGTVLTVCLEPPYVVSVELFGLCSPMQWHKIHLSWRAYRQHTHLRVTAGTAGLRALNYRCWHYSHSSSFIFNSTEGFSIEAEKSACTYKCTHKCTWTWNLLNESPVFYPKTMRCCIKDSWN